MSVTESEEWQEMCRILADAHNMLDHRDELIRELVAALLPFTCCGDRKYLLDEEFASAEDALAKAKAAGFEP